MIKENMRKIKNNLNTLNKLEGNIKKVHRNKRIKKIEKKIMNGKMQKRMINLITLNKVILNHKKINSINNIQNKKKIRK